MVACIGSPSSAGFGRGSTAGAAGPAGSGASIGTGQSNHIRRRKRNFACAPFAAHFSDHAGEYGRKAIRAWLAMDARISRAPNRPLEKNLFLERGFLLGVEAQRVGQPIEESALEIRDFAVGQHQQAG